MNESEMGRINTTVALGRLRGAIMEALAGDDFTALRLLLPQYAVKLESLVMGCAGDAGELQRLQSEHGNFFEQLRSILVTSRIQMRFELERLRVSRSYDAESEKEAQLVMHG